jgi:RecB family exonuclease
MPGRHLSVSQLRLLLGCARQWRLQYLDGLRPPPTVDLVVGVVWHAAIEDHLGRRLRGEPADRGASGAALAEAWAREAARPDVDWRGRTPGSARRLTERLFAAYLRDLAPLVAPVAVEAPFSVAIPGAPGWTLDGRIDAVADDGWLIDQKTAGAPYTPEQVDADLQALAYLWAWRERHGAEAPGMAFHVAVKPSPADGGAVATQELVTRRTAAQLDWFAGLLREAVRQVEAEAFPPDPGYRWCHRCPAVWAARCMPWRAAPGPTHDPAGLVAGDRLAAAGNASAAGDGPADRKHRG